MSVTKAKRAAVIERWGTECWICHEPIDLTLPYLTPRGYSVDHVRPRAYGGSDDLTNLRPAHRQCNIARGHTWRPFRFGLRVIS